MSKDKYPVFETVKVLDPVEGRSNMIHRSVVKITQDDESSSNHIVLKKVKINADGSPRGEPQQFFIPVGMWEEVSQIDPSNLAEE